MAYVRDKIFANIGKRIAVWYHYEDTLGALELAREQQITLLDDSEDEGDWLRIVLDTYQEHKDLIDDMRASTVADVTTYLLTGVRQDLGVVERDVDEVIDELEDQMLLAGDCILENIEQYDDASQDPELNDIDNAGTSILEFVAEVHQSQQFMHDEYEFELECYDVSAGAGSEYWKLLAHDNKRPGTKSKLIESRLQTGVPQQVIDYGLNLQIDRRTTIAEFNDGANQLSNWVLDDAVKSKGDIEDPDFDGDTDFHGRCFVELTDLAGTRTVDLYKDAAKTILVATGSRVGDGTINLAVQPGYSINGTVDVAYTGDDLDIYLILPFDIAVGDKLKFSTSITTRGLFQYFFVENYDKALPSCTDGNETVDENFAIITGWIL